MIAKHAATDHKDKIQRLLNLAKWQRFLRRKGRPEGSLSDGGYFVKMVGHTLPWRLFHRVIWHQPFTTSSHISTASAKGQP